VKDVCTVQGQSGPLEQRLSLLSSLVRESEVNSELRDVSGDLSSCSGAAGSLIIVESTCRTP